MRVSYFANEDDERIELVTMLASKCGEEPISQVLKDIGALPGAISETAELDWQYITEELDSLGYARL